MFIRLLCCVLCISLFSQCSGDSDVRDKAKAEAEQLAQQTASSPQTAPAPQAEVAPGQTPPTSGETLTMVMGNAEVDAGQEACLPISATGFTNLIGLQFSIRWDRDELKYTAIRNMELTDLGPQNFGDTHNELGVVGVSWIHQSLQGVSIPADSHLFDICFIPQTPSGSKVDVRFESRPVAFEVINTKEEILQFSGVNGQIKVK